MLSTNLCKCEAPIYVNVIIVYHPLSFDDLRQQLDENGVAVLANVIPQNTCDDAITTIHAWLAQFGSGFPDNVGSIIHKYGVAHHQAAWEVRLGIKPVFSGLWGTEKLLCSCDGIAIGRPPESGPTSFDNPPYNSAANNLHLDQGPKRVGLHCYQGAVYLEEALADDWCFLVIEKSHQLHEDYFSSHTTNAKTEFLKLNEEQQRWYLERGCEIKRVPAPKGGIILWDSRTVHAGAPPLAGRENPHRWRYVVFACMAPAIWANPGDLHQKRLAYRNRRISRHWPANGVSLFPNYASTPLDVGELPEIARSDEARRLAGDLEYDFEDSDSNGPGWSPEWK